MLSVVYDWRRCRLTHFATKGRARVAMKNRGRGTDVADRGHALFQTTRLSPRTPFFTLTETQSFQSIIDRNARQWPGVFISRALMIVRARAQSIKRDCKNRATMGDCACRNLTYQVKQIQKENWSPVGANENARYSTMLHIVPPAAFDAPNRTNASTKARGQRGVGRRETIKF